MGDAVGNNSSHLRNNILQSILNQHVNITS